MSLSHAQRFQRLSALLAEWRPLPFQHREMPWGGRVAGLADTLLALPGDAVERLQAAPFEDSPLAAWLPVDALAELAALPVCPSPAALPDGWGEGIGARTWRQIQAFASRVPVEEGELVEWCAGKGHLSRTLARLHRRPVTGLEWQPSLCEAGQDQADREGLAVRLQPQDVMAPDAARWLAPDVRVAALHACGDLHGRLLTLAAETGSAVSLAPCCYHRTAAAHYRPLSRQGRELLAAQDWTPSREDLAMAVQETVTAPRGVRRHRERTNAWRLGFDLLQREVRRRDAYLPVPSLAYGKLPDGFAGFCHWAAEQKGLVLPAGLDWSAYEAAGWRRLAAVSRLELVRHLFRRPLEVWLALDRVRLLEEAGFRVTLATFCERALTPRNLLIEATPP